VRCIFKTPRKSNELFNFFNMLTHKSQQPPTLLLPRIKGPAKSKDVSTVKKDLPIQDRNQQQRHQLQRTPSIKSTDQKLIPRKQLQRSPAIKSILKPIQPSSTPTHPKEDPQTILKIGLVNLSDKIGKGASGIVRLGSTSDKKRSVFAVKLMKRSLDAKTQLYHIREAYITSLLNHPNIIELREAVLTPCLFALSYKYLHLNL
jgi:hypothetical protein